MFLLLSERSELLLMCVVYTWLAEVRAQDLLCTCDPRVHVLFSFVSLSLLGGEEVEGIYGGCCHLSPWHVLSLTSPLHVYLLLSVWQLAWKERDCEVSITDSMEIA